MRPKKAKIPVCAWKPISPKGLKFDLRYAPFFERTLKELSFDTQVYEFMFNGWREIQVESFVSVKKFTKILLFFKTVAESKGYEKKIIFKNGFCQFFWASDFISW